MRIRASLRNLTIVSVATLGVWLTGCSSSPPDAEQQAGSPDSNSELLELRQSALNSLAQRLGLDPPPDVDLIRFVMRTESGAIQADCMRAAGYDATASSDGAGLTFGQVDEAQLDDFNRALYTCTAQYSIDPRYGLAPTEDQLAILHAYFVDTLVPCLTERQIDVGDVPTLASFREAYLTDGWSPYAEIAASGIAAHELDRLMSECPLSPPDSELYDFESEY